MRRHHRAGGPTVHAGKVNGGPVPDPFALIRAFDSETNPTKPVRPSPLTASTIQGLPLDLIDRLRSFPLFLSAPDSFLAAIGTHLRPQLYSPHDTIIAEGDEAKAMYWLVRGAVRVTSRDGESTFAELRPGAFFGEIGILMEIPRTATIVAKMRSMVVRLNKEDLKKELPKFPEVEQSILDEAKERLAILERKKKELRDSKQHARGPSRSGKRTRDTTDGDVEMGDAGEIRDGEVVVSNKKRKSPSPGLAEAAASSAIGSGVINVRQLLKELPLFSSMPSDILHFLGLNAQPRTYPPFTDIIQQGSHGRDVFFIVRGEVEVVSETPPDEETRKKQSSPKNIQHVIARLKPGQYFGEVVSLDLAPRRTATVRSIASVECLAIGGDVLNELWQRCSPELRQQIESTARARLEAAAQRDTEMTDVCDGTPAINELVINDRTPESRRTSLPAVTFTDSFGESKENGFPPKPKDEGLTIEPFDPDPFLNVDLDNARSRSRRASLAPPPPGAPPVQEPAQETPKSQDAPKLHHESPKPNGLLPSPIFTQEERLTPERSSSFKRQKIVRRPSRKGKGILPDIILVKIFQHLDIGELMRLRIISMHWLKIVTSSPSILYDLDLTPYNRRVTDRVLTDIICPFVGQRPRSSNSNSKFNNFPPGFQHWSVYPFPNLTRICLADCTYLTDNAIVFLTNAAKALRELDLSFCCALSDTATEVLALGCPMLTHLNLAFCGSAVSDSSLRSISLHLLELKYLSVRGCVRVTGTGVEAVLEGCSDLEEFDVSQCKNLSRWIDNGGIQRKGRGVKFATVADGTWRVPRT
ncbi:Cyclic nucleotide-binding domain-containing protein [Neofusicoccum parvum]|uniref:Cyclic nucleotide-binding domain-containing protein n=1 Tax=Neofusicoccum parvum TaxID=310453 RepID=A0ACB5RPV0_9PEZI|nr:Cyclic nucleotide-binding domain-containing protein [Neofusicoccum parvum]